MATATLERRVKVLEEQVRVLVERDTTQLGRASGQIKARAILASAKGKKHPKWLRESLQDVAEGRVRGPFATVRELRASIESDD